MSVIETTRLPAPDADGPDDATPSLLLALEDAIEGEVRFDDYTRHLFSRDASMYAVRPLGAVFPRHTADVAAAVRIAAEHGVTVTARGAATSLAGQTTGPGIVLDLSRHMTAISSLDAENRVAVVQPGVVQDTLNQAAAPHGLMFGPDTSTSNRATIGGMIGNNSAGSGSLRFGMTIDHVRRLTVVLADGSVAEWGPITEEERAERSRGTGLDAAVHRGLPWILEQNADAIATGFPPFWRRACGYRLDRLADPDTPFDLATFVVGAEGTLAIVTEAEVDLVPKPRATVYAVGHFESTQQAIEATTDALSCEPAQVEMMDKTILDLSRNKIEYAPLSASLVGDPAALLFVSFTGDTTEDVTPGLDRLIDLWERNGHGYATLRLVDPAEQAQLLKVRKASLGLLMAASEGTNRPLAFVEDTAVPPEHLAEYTRRFAQVLQEHGMDAGFYGHCSVGCLHIRPFVDVSDPDEVARMRSVAVAVKDLVREYGGVNSSEHGDGLARSEFNEEIFGPALYGAMQQVKRLFDPEGTLNPGKIVDAPPMTDNLRDAALPPAPPLRTRLDFEVTGGMRGAADRCMNIGACRKSTSGVMCPSYIATLDEEHATRGRAGALVKALSEADPHRALGDERLHEVLDLCLMCKACKSECPLGVDMAKLKTETLAAHHDLHGTPLRSRVFGSIRTLNRLGSLAAPLANATTALPPVRALLSRLGIAEQRRLPHYAAEDLIRWGRRRARRTGAGPGAASPLGPVNLLADSFTSFSEPHIGRAAVGLLEIAGYDVGIVDRGCCGRSALSKGLVDQAKVTAQKLSRHLADETPAGSPIVGMEPSCLFTLTDDHRSLFPGDPGAADVAGRVRQIEELLGEAIDGGSLPVQDSWLSGRTVVYHGHCHQKAEVGTAATVALLKRIPGLTVQELDAGCCGMAGSFGYEAEHYELSLKVGEDRLFPAVRAAEDAVVAASGTSCREQIFHGTQRTAWHPIELLGEAVRGARTPWR